MTRIYSREPTQVGRFYIDCPEMMFVQDMPVKMPFSDVEIPSRLGFFTSLVLAAIEDFGRTDSHECYIYLSAKRLFTGPTCSWNRPGWHIDGYGTEDVNYLWSDSFPTEFCVGQEFDLSEDHILSMQQMDEQASPQHIKTYPNNMLLGVDNTIVHRVAEPMMGGIRTFAKVSISRNKYNRMGNAHNELFDYKWDMIERTVQRNYPAAN